MKPFNVIIKERRLNYLHHLLTRPKNSMLYSFFIKQWNSPTRGDWTEQVKGDLKDLEIPCSFSHIQNFTKDAFKKDVKKKANNFALKELLKKKSVHSKMKKLNYNNLEIQNYFLEPSLKVDEIKTVFRYRTRMEKFGENYRGGKTEILCPLCKSHRDSQELSFQCAELKTITSNTGNIEEIYSENIGIDIIKTIFRISEFRKESSMSVK